MNTPLIETRHLKKYFETSSGLLHAVDDVNLTIGRARLLELWENQVVENQHLVESYFVFWKQLQEKFCMMEKIF